jgi:hypothetical protein
MYGKSKLGPRAVLSAILKGIPEVRPGAIISSLKICMGKEEEVSQYISKEDSTGVVS